MRSIRLIRATNGQLALTPPSAVDWSSPTRLAGHNTIVGRPRLHRPACLRRRRLVSPPIRSVGHTTVHGRPRHHRPAGLRRLVFPPTRLAYYAAICGHLRFHRRPPSSPPTGVLIVIDGRLCSHIGHFCHHQGEYYKAKSSFILFFI